MDWERLLDNLELQTKRHGELLGLLEKEATLPVDASLHDLETLHHEKEDRLAGLRRLETERLVLMAEGGLGELPLKKVVAECRPESTRRALADKREELLGILAEIRSLNRFNEKMIQGRQYALSRWRERLNEGSDAKKLYSFKGKTFSTPPSELRQRWI